MILKRFLSNALVDWKNDPKRKPLLIRGARQVGKSSLIELFGAEYFNNVLTINFELSPEYCSCFESLNPQEICDALRVISQQPLTPGGSLLFLDEIQDCPAAIRSLRYFKELMPELHVIGAGSLLELVLNQADYRMPVGRVSFLYCYPMTFKEFLQAFNPEAIAMIEAASFSKPLPQALHLHLLKQLHLYLLLGGMPEVLSDYYSNRQIEKIQPIQAAILETYEKDFGHYAKATQLDELRVCFSRIPMMLGEQIKYNKIDPDKRSRELKSALSVLELAGLLHRIHASNGKGLPLDASINEKKFKMIFLDVGLMKRINQLDTSLLLHEDIMLLNRGMLAEQFVGQELLAYAPTYEKAKLYFWARDKGSKAEVDYLQVIGSSIIPIEVKAGKTGRLRSLKQYLSEHDCPVGVRISESPLQVEKDVLSIPLYLVSELKRLVQEV